ncbi:unnamed protein product [Vitrella brassicaformis CCMP3155]|uniref:WDHD1/CFT4 second beta-propeller domain-containing protein n=2 Tax=Vitrella brassicaformis TaxID=1169539 RepID=A0A0G4FWM4_VITBC|nr:unnamed protein product [Vitrella brassicaformis CCMP3155]|eukprot:CEM19541.1 unnamed protein product [Vitrella brassicaformis CCMP3155]
MAAEGGGDSATDVQWHSSPTGELLDKGGEIILTNSSLYLSDFAAGTLTPITPGPPSSLAEQPIFTAQAAAQKGIKAIAVFAGNGGGGGGDDGDGGSSHPLVCVGDGKGEVWVHRYSDGVYKAESLVCRTAGEIRYVSFCDLQEGEDGVRGLKVGCCVDLGTVILFDVNTKKRFECGPVEGACSLAVDPRGEFLAVASADGPMVIYEIRNFAEDATGAEDFSGKDYFHKTAVTCTNRLLMAWHPKADFLVVSGERYPRPVTRDSWLISEDLQKHTKHTDAVHFLCWDAEGSILVSGGADHSVMIWRCEAENNIYPIHTFPVGVSGGFHLISMSCAEAFTDAGGDELLQERKALRIGLLRRDGTWALPCFSKSLLYEGKPPQDSEGREDGGRKQAGGLDGRTGAKEKDRSVGKLIDDEANEAGDEEPDGPPVDLDFDDLDMADPPPMDDTMAGGGLGASSTMAVDEDKVKKIAMDAMWETGAPQEAFMPCSTLFEDDLSGLKDDADADQMAVDGDRRRSRFLCWNSFGWIVLREGGGDAHDDGHIIEMRFTFMGGEAKTKIKHDPDREYSLASISERGAVFAKVGVVDPFGEPDANRAKIEFYPYQTWQSDTHFRQNWTYALSNDEQIDNVAVGGEFVAAMTNMRYLRLFDASGVQLSVTCLDGPCVSSAAFDSLLMVVTHAQGSAYTRTNEQCLAFTLYDIKSSHIVSKGPVSLSPGSQLSWIAFSETAVPLTMDTLGIVRALLPCWSAPGGRMDFSWAPVLDYRAEGQGMTIKEDDPCQWWPVQATGDEVFAVHPPRGVARPYPRHPLPGNATVPRKLAMPFCGMTKQRPGGVQRQAKDMSLGDTEELRYRTSLMQSLLAYGSNFSIPSFVCDLSGACAAVEKGKESLAVTFATPLVERRLNAEINAQQSLGRLMSMARVRAAQEVRLFKACVDTQQLERALAVYKRMDPAGQAIAPATKYALSTPSASQLAREIRKYNEAREEQIAKIASSITQQQPTPLISPPQETAAAAAAPGGGGGAGGGTFKSEINSQASSGAAGRGEQQQPADGRPNPFKRKQDGTAGGNDSRRGGGGGGGGRGGGLGAAKKGRF